MMNNSHFCILCGREFQSADPEAEFCPEHSQQKPPVENDLLEETLGPVTLLPEFTETPPIIDYSLYRSEPTAAWQKAERLRSANNQNGLMQYLKRSPNLELRRAAAWALGVLGEKRAVPLLRQTMQDADDLLKFHSACALARLGDFQIMMQFLGEERPAFLPGMQLSAFDPWDWVKSHGREAVEGVLNELGYPLNFIFLRIGADLVIEYGDHALVPVLWRNLQHEDYRIRAVAAHKLGSLPEKESCEHLIPLLGDEVDVVADRAADALRMIGKAALPALRMVVDDAIRTRVQELIAQIEAADG